MEDLEYTFSENMPESGRKNKRNQKYKEDTAWSLPKFREGKALKSPIGGCGTESFC